MINTVVILGNLTKDPEQRMTSSGKKVANFSIAVNGYNEHVDYFNVETWGKTAEFVTKYLQKGSQVVVAGRLMQKVWEKDGEKHYEVVIVADNVQSTSSNKSDSKKGTQTELLEQIAEEAESKQADEIDYDSIPF